MLDPKLEKLNKILELLGEGTMTPKEVEKFLLVILETVKKAKQNLDISAKEVLKEVKGVCEKSESEQSKMVSKMEKESEKMMKECESKITQIEKILKEAKDMPPKTITERTEVIKEVPMITEVAKKVDMTPNEIANSLESIKKEEDKLSIEAISGLEELIKKLEKKIAKKQSGGRVFIGGPARLVNQMKVETPVGAIDGNNRAYTVKGRIGAVLNFTINGQFIHPSEYSFNVRTITFTNALPESLSGTSFTIVYV